MQKLIYWEKHKSIYLRDTWVELIGVGSYVITQTGYGNGKKQHFTVFLSRKQIDEFLKEREVRTKN